jgi:hypothetical protein
MCLFPKLIVRLELLERYLVPASLLYLALPYAIFCIGWLQWYWALLAMGFLAVALMESTRFVFLATETASSSEVTPLFTLRHLLFLLLVSLVWLTLSGIGGVGSQRGDWIKHESVLKDLIEYDWPVVYDYYASPVPLVYYLAYYLPAAVIGKIDGWGMAQVALFIWTFLGINLAMLWFWILVHKASYFVLIIFIFFSGWDLFGRAIANSVGWSMNYWRSLERWSLDLEYSANTALLFWVPNQALAGWIAAGITLYALLRLRHRRLTLLHWGLVRFGRLLL